MSKRKRCVAPMHPNARGALDLIESLACDDPDGDDLREYADEREADPVMRIPASEALAKIGAWQDGVDWIPRYTAEEIASHLLDGVEVTQKSAALKRRESQMGGVL